MEFGRAGIHPSSLAPRKEQKKNQISQFKQHDDKNFE